MKSNVSKSIVVTSGGVDGPKSFGMKVNEKAFSILISGIYQHKIKAIVRELSTNAWDSHKQAKNLVPFDVHLPTSNNPVFIIRDYGIGLTQQELEDIYFNFFASTKEDSNEYTGFIGIGSKVPLCYNTKSFNVESFRDGTHYIYSCFIGSNNVPDYKLEYTGPTTEPNGMKIKVAVNPSDITEFVECAEEVYRWFDTKPNFTSTTKPKFDQKDVVTTNEVFELHKYTSATAVMGHIAYPIVNCHGLAKYSNLISQGIILKFEIGEIEFNAAREGLEYTPKTIKRLCEKFESVISFVEKEIENQIASAKSTFGAIKKFRELRATYSMFNLLNNTTKFKYNGNLVDGYQELKADNQYYYNGSNGKIRKEFRIELGTIYVLDDLNIGAKTRCKELSRNSQSVVLLQSVDNLGIDIHESDYILASGLPKPPANSKAGKKVSSFMKMLNSRHVTYAWEHADINTAITKYYVVRKGYHVFHDGEKYLPFDIYKRMELAKLTGPIYGVSADEEESIIEAGFINAIDECDKEIIKVKSKVDKEIPFLEQYYFERYMFNKHGYLPRHAKELKNHLSKDSELFKYGQLLAEHEKKQTKVSGIEKEISFLKQAGYNINYNTYNNYNTIISPTEQSLVDNHPVVKKYPLLKSSFLPSGDTQHLLHYVIGVNYASSSTQF